MFISIIACEISNHASVYLFVRVQRDKYRYMQDIPKKFIFRDFFFFFCPFKSIKSQIFRGDIYQHTVCKYFLPELSAEFNTEPNISNIPPNLNIDFVTILLIISFHINYSLRLIINNYFIDFC